VITSRINGLRVRQRPGVEAQIVTGLLPLGAEMEVIMGPFLNDQIGWYLVSDADPAEPEFEEGWVAAGYDPDPLLGATGRRVDGAPYVISMAATGDAEEGPIELGEGDHAIRWVARDPEGVRCTFGVTLDRPGADPVPTIRATVGNGIDRGTLQPETFAALAVRGPAFVSVTSDCTWALVLFRVTRDEPSPSPSPSPS
jgi:hypothetical protein